ncbi:hypothetical protein GCM10027445_48900 [Amycolatopsis endophytica]|uniref:Uncharacterized protein n=1 Tax=Amycolatopsis endophytica TaxID=860233 RepID=A0A853BF63_9PSEU|nr:hypothetical protein [Amycolatopsis endophytica]NYI93405.1 hypothetical protein [Amycolatopsis endophytica]
MLPHGRNQQLHHVLFQLVIGIEVLQGGAPPRAEEAAAAFPDNHIFRFRLAAGRRLRHRYGQALDGIDAAPRLLPATGKDAGNDELRRSLRTSTARAIDLMTVSTAVVAGTPRRGGASACPRPGACDGRSGSRNRGNY